MHPLKIILIIFVSLMAIGGAGYLYAAHGLESKPGYVSFGLPQGVSINALLSINVGPNGVKSARRLLEKLVSDSGHADHLPEKVFKSALRELKGVQLRVYNVGNNRQIFDSAIADSVVSLKQKSWQTLATIREDDVKIAVLQYLDGAHIAGLSIMASTPDKALFLNLVGPFDVDAIAKTAGYSH